MQGYASAQLTHPAARPGRAEALKIHTGPRLCPARPPTHPPARMGPGAHITEIHYSLCSVLHPSTCQAETGHMLTYTQGDAHPPTCQDGPRHRDVLEAVHKMDDVAGDGRAGCSLQQAHERVDTLGVRHAVLHSTEFGARWPRLGFAGTHKALARWAGLVGLRGHKSRLL